MTSETASNGSPTPTHKPSCVDSSTISPALLDCWARSPEGDPMGELVRLSRLVVVSLTTDQLDSLRTAVAVLGQVLTDESDSRLD